MSYACSFGMGKNPNQIKKHKNHGYDTGSLIHQKVNGDTTEDQKLATCMAVNLLVQ